MQKTYDVIIVGAGMAGLYTAFLLKLHNPKISLLVLEQNKREHVGGRANTELFYGAKIAIGAGIGRAKKDKLLTGLMRHYKMPIHQFPVEHNIATTQYIDVQQTMHQLKKEYEKHTPRSPQTFRQFATHVLGKTDYARFIHSTGFTDYENEDAYETIYEYGMEDNLDGWKAFSVPWHDLVESMYKSVGTSSFMFGKKVTGIEQNQNDKDKIINVRTISNLSKPEIYTAKKVVMATTVDSLRQVFPKNAIYKEIEPQPFMRVYGKFDKASVGILTQVLPRFTYVDFPIQKIIPMDAEKGVYMIVYNDNANTLALKKRCENSAQNRKFYENLLEDVLALSKGSLHLIAIRSFYWKYGTHYYKPLADNYKTREEFIRKAQRPCENVYVVGELVSRNQGWTEGALESVVEIIREICTQKEK